MRNRHHRLLLVGSVLAAFTLVVASSTAAGVSYPDPSPTNLIDNGSFEDGDDPGASTTVTAPAALIGWNVTGGNIDYIGSAMTAADGSRCIELSGSSNGALETAPFATIAGQSYRISFVMSGNPGGGDVVKNMQLDIIGSDLIQASALSFDTTGSTAPDLSWAAHEVTIVADGSSMRLRFISLETDGFGPIVDNVACRLVYHTTLAALAVPASAGVLANDDGNGNPLTVASFSPTSASGATVAVAADGGFVYDPTTSATLLALASGQTALDTFTYVATDGVAALAPQTATVSVTQSISRTGGFTDMPGEFATDEDTVLTAAMPGVLTEDAGAAPLTITGYDAVSVLGANVVVGANGSLSYDPTAASALQGLLAGELAIDSFSYTYIDNLAVVRTDIETVVVIGIADAPVAQDDAGATDADTVLIVPSPGSLGNDQAVDGSSSVIPVANASFEIADVADFLSGAAADWIVSPGGFASNIDPGSVHFSGTNGDNANGGIIPCGGQLGLVQDAGLGPAFQTSLTQDLGIAAAPNSTYTLSLWIGNSLAVGAVDYRVELLAGATTIIVADNPVVPLAGTFEFLSLNGATGPVISGNLEVRLSAIDTTAATLTTTYFDCVQVRVAPARQGALTVVAYDALSVAGASVVVDANGGYSYDPTWSASLSALPLAAIANDTFTYTAENSSGLQDVATVTITVTGTGTGDVTPPLITCPGDLSVAADSSTNPATTGSATALDGSDPMPVVTYSDVVSATCAPTTITRTWTATDNVANSSTCEQTISVDTLTCSDIETLVLSQLCGASPATLAAALQLFQSLLTAQLTGIIVCDDGSPGSTSNQDCFDYVLAAFDAAVAALP